LSEVLVEIISENLCYGGIQGVYRHASSACNCDMTFGVFLPPQAKLSKVPVIWFLSGLTCTHENAMVKAGAQGWASKHGVAIVFPDTSPRGEQVADDESYDLGQGAGFYVDATEKPWSPNYNMWTYISEELQGLVISEFSVDDHKQGIMGHSMGGHGALTLALSLPKLFRSVSAFSPICNPTISDWGKKQFAAYLGPNEDLWRAHDATILMEEKGFDNRVLIDQGKADNFNDLLMLNSIKSVITSRKQVASLRVHDGYDHSYFFIQSFMEDHIRHHIESL